PGDFGSDGPVVLVRRFPARSHGRPHARPARARGRAGSAGLRRPGRRPGPRPSDPGQPARDLRPAGGPPRPRGPRAPARGDAGMAVAPRRGGARAALRPRTVRGPRTRSRRAARPAQGDLDPMSTRDLLLAVDGGGTKTEAVVTDLEGRVLSRGLGAGSNHYTGGFGQLVESVTTAVQAALRPVLGAGVE